MARDRRYVVSLTRDSQRSDTPVVSSIMDARLNNTCVVSGYKQLPRMMHTAGVLKERHPIHRHTNGARLRRQLALLHTEKERVGREAGCFPGLPDTPYRDPEPSMPHCTPRELEDVMQILVGGRPRGKASGVRGLSYGTGR